MKGPGVLLCLMALVVAMEAVDIGRRITFQESFNECYEMYAAEDFPVLDTQSQFRLFAEIEHGDYSFVFFNKLDVDLIGYKDNSTAGLRYYYCTDKLHQEKKCYDSQVGAFIVDNTRTNHSEILTGGTYLQGQDKNDIIQTYNIHKKGQYCLMFHNITAGNLTSGNLNIQSPYGNLPAPIYPFLIFYGVLGLVYLGVGVIWLTLSACYWKEILHIQNYISGIIFLCMIEMTFMFAYFADYNDSGIPSNALLSLAVILGSARYSVSFVCLLVACMGYGLVKPTLGSTAHKVLGLGFVHFVFNTLFAASRMLKDGKPQAIMSYLFVFPLAITLTLFYTWTFNSLTITIKKLEIRRQSAKTTVYRRLWRLLMFSILVVFIIVIFAIIQRFDDNYDDLHWDTRWFIEDGWTNVLYFFMFIVIAYLWRPQKNNARYGMTEVPQGDDDDITTTGSTKLKMRSLGKNKSRKASDEEDALQWVEDNISEPEDSIPLTIETEPDEKVARRELAKMN